MTGWLFLMRCVAAAGFIVSGAVFLAAGTLPASARPAIGASGRIASPMDYPGAPRRFQDKPAPAPYAMNYAEEAVQTLGFRDGHMEVFSAKPDPDDTYLPAFSGGLGADGAMLKLQWHPGE